MMHHYSSVIDFSFDKYIVSAGHRNSWWYWKRCNEDADEET